MQPVAKKRIAVKVSPVTGGDIGTNDAICLESHDDAARVCA